MPVVSKGQHGIACCDVAEPGLTDHYCLEPFDGHDKVCRKTQLDNFLSDSGPQSITLPVAKLKDLPHL